MNIPTPSEQEIASGLLTKISAAGTQSEAVSFTNLATYMDTDIETEEEVLYSASTSSASSSASSISSKVTTSAFSASANAVVSTDKDTFAFYFYNKDHLGNIREVVDENGSVCQVTNYYPFGTPYSDETSTTNADLQPYKYNSKELDRMHGLDTYDYGARQYAPVLCRWDRIDPLCGKYYGVSPYVYCHNNPIMLTDPDGRDDRFDKDGNFIERTKDGTEVVIIDVNGNYQYILDVDFTNQTSVIKNIASHYLSQYDKGCNISVTPTGDGISQDAAFSNDPGTHDYDVYLTNGHVNKSMGNCYNFECITFHESIHSSDPTTLGGTIGETSAVIRTANECISWYSASDDYIRSQASYAANELNLYLMHQNPMPNNMISNLNAAFTGYASFNFDIKKNRVSVTNLLKECIITGTKRQ